MAIKIKFTSRIWKTGKSHVITIPSDFIKSLILEPKKSYEFEVDTKVKK